MNAPATQNATIALDIEHVSKRYGPKIVHRDLNFQLLDGEILALFGGSGTGKSVFLRCVIGLEKPDAGKIVFEGQDVTKLNERDLVVVRQKIGFVFQNGALFDSMSVYDNLAYPLREHTAMTEREIADRVREMLDLIDMKGSEPLLPASLSGGMQKRVGVARAIILRPKIILYDEPTAGLDPTNTHRLLELMLEIQKRGNTAIFVTHDIPSALKVADRVAILYDGRIHAIDTTERIRASKDPVIRKFLQGEELHP